MMAVDQRIAGAKLAGSGPAAAEGGSDARLWDDLSSQGDHARFGQAWLSIIGRTFPAIRQGLLLLPGESATELLPVARWASDATTSSVETLVARSHAVLDNALASGKPVQDQPADAAGLVYTAIPLLIDGVAAAVAVAEARVADDLTGRRLIRHLQWGLAWVEAYLRRAQGDSGRRQAERAADLIDFLAIGLEAEGLENAARALVNELAQRFDCDRAAIGWRKGHSMRLLALSQSPDVERRGEIGTAFEAAMDEACDQGRILGTQATGGFVAYGQMALARQFGGTHVLTVPLSRPEGPVGAVTLIRRAAAFAPDEITLIDACLAPAAPILHEKALSDRSLPVLLASRAGRFARMLVGPDHLAAKAVAMLAIVLGLAAWFATGTFNVTARGQVQGEVRRVVTAPFDGFIRSQQARAGETVRAGHLLAELQDNDLTLDRLRHLAQRRQYQLDHDRALARRELAQVNIAKAQMDQKDAEIELTDTMLGRTRIQAPFDAVIVSGDLSQQIGRPVSRGDILFELAPLDRYRVTLLVPELQIGSVKPGQTGVMLLTALPEEPLALEIESVTPVSRISDGVNGFEVLAKISTSNPRLRPAMEGVAKINAGEARLVWIWTHQFWRWLRIRLWSWLP
jgi:multidrug resistance efflux pump